MYSKVICPAALKELRVQLPRGVCALSPSLPLSLSPFPSLLHAGMLLHSLLFVSLGWHALTLRGWILLLSSK